MPEYPLPKFEELVFKAIVDRFFEPVVAYQSQWAGTDPHGKAIYQQVAVYSDPPVNAIANTIYKKYHDEIAEAVFAKIELEEMGERIAASVVNGLTEKRGTAFEVDSHEMKEIRKQARERVADTLHQRMLDEIDNEGTK